MKKSLTIWLFLFIFIAGFASAQQLSKLPPGAFTKNDSYLTRELRGYWAFSGGGSRVQDISGNNNHGVFVNGPTWVGGKYGKSMQFVRASTQYLNVGNDKSFDLPNGLTIFARVKRNSINLGEYIIVKHGVVLGDTTLSWGFRLDETPAFAHFYIYSGSLRWAKFDALELNDTVNWHTIHLTHDNVTAKLYIDGKFSEAIALAYTPPTNTNDVLIGYYGRVTASYDGALSEVGVWGRVFSAEEVRGHYNNISGIYRHQQAWLYVESAAVTIPLFYNHFKQMGN